MTKDPITVLREALEALLAEYKEVVNSAYCQLDEAEDVTAQAVAALATAPAAIQPAGDGWDYQTMGLPNEEIFEIWRDCGHSGVVPFSFVYRLEERLRTHFASPVSAPVPEAVAVVLGAAPFAGHAAQPIPTPMWLSNTLPPIGTRLYAAPVPEAHPDDIAVDRFAAAMKAKMAASRAKGRSGWSDPTQCTDESLARMLVNHVSKGDPVDIANFAMMLHQREAAAVEHHPCNGGAAVKAIRHASAERTVSIQKEKTEQPGAHHLTAENIVAVIADLRSIEDGTTERPIEHRDMRAQAGIWHRIISHLSAAPAVKHEASGLPPLPNPVAYTQTSERYSADQMHAYVLADRAVRQSAPIAGQGSIDSPKFRALVDSYVRFFSTDEPGEKGEQYWAAIVQHIDARLPVAAAPKTSHAQDCVCDSCVNPLL